MKWIDLATYFGNQCFADAWDYLTIDSGSEQISIRFTAQASKTVDKIYIDVGAEYTDQQIDIQIGLQGDSGGEPDGTWLGSVIKSFTADRAINALECDITPNVALTAGTVYHIVIAPTGLNMPNATNYIQAGDWGGTLRNLVPHPDIQVADANQNLLFYDGSSWIEQDKQPLFSLLFTDGAYEGYPYGETMATSRNVYGSQYAGEIFLSVADRLVNAIDLYTRRTGTVGQVTDDLYVDIDYSKDGGATWLDIITVTFAKADVGTALAWVSKTLDTLIRFDPAYTYRIEITSPNAGFPYVYEVQAGRYSGAILTCWRQVGWGDTTYYWISDAAPTGDLDMDLCLRLTLIDDITPYLCSTMMGCGL